MMKRPPSDTKHRLSSLCRWVLVLGVCKLSLLGTLLLVEDTETKFANSGLLPVSAHAANDVQLPSSSTGNALTPPAPQVRGQRQVSPFAQQPDYSATSTMPGANSAMQGAPAPQSSVRPDQPAPVVAPAPQINPYVPKDSAQRKQEELNRREQELLALQQQMQSRLEELHKLENRIQGMLKQADNLQDDKLRHLIDVYSNMKAKQAAQVLATLDERIAVRILSGMRGKQAGEVLSYMDAEPAAKLSELLSKTQLP